MSDHVEKFIDKRLCLFRVFEGESIIDIQGEQDQDCLSYEIPAHLVELWQTADKIGREICRDIQTIYRGIEKRMRAGDVLLAEVTPQTVIDLKYIWRCLQQVIPWAVCPYDLGDEIKREGCRACHGKGYLSKFRWDRCVPKDKKATHIKLIKTDGLATN